MSTVLFSAFKSTFKSTSSLYPYHPSPSPQKYQMGSFWTRPSPRLWRTFILQLWYWRRPSQETIHSSRTPALEASEAKKICRRLYPCQLRQRTKQLYKSVKAAARMAILNLRFSSIKEELNSDANPRSMCSCKLKIYFFQLSITSKTPLIQITVVVMQ